MTRDKFRSAFDPLRIFQQWWGEPLSKELYDRAINAPLEQQWESLRFAEHAAEPYLPDLEPGALRPLLVEDGIHFANYTDYLSAAATLALYVDEVAIEYMFGSSPRWFIEYLGDLLAIMPLAETGTVRFFKPNLSVHRSWPEEVENEFVRIKTELGKSEWDRLTKALSQFKTPLGTNWSVKDALWLVLSQLSAKTATPAKISLLALSDAENILLNLAAGLSRSNPIDTRGYELAKLVGLRVPIYAVDLPTLIGIRESEATFAELREATRRALVILKACPMARHNGKTELEKSLPANWFRCSNE